MIHHGDDDTWIEADRYDLPDIAQVLDGKLFGEDVLIASEPDAWTGFQLHGPASAQLLGELGGDAAQVPGQTPGTHHVVDLAGVKATVYRHEPCGVLGFGIWCKADDAATLWKSMLDAAGYDPDAEVDASFGEQRRQGLRGRPVGWEAFNTARIEAGTPMFHIDFGPDSLPGETGLLESRVSFTKGCYLGQEIVARMQNLGHPKRMLAGFQIESNALPVAGTQVLDAPGEDAKARRETRCEARCEEEGPRRRQGHRRHHQLDRLPPPRRQKHRPRRPAMGQAHPRHPRPRRHPRQAPRHRNHPTRLARGVSRVAGMLRRPGSRCGS